MKLRQQRSTLFPYTTLFRSKEQSFTQELAPGVMIEGDRDLLFQMVSNLIDNAIKYTPEHGGIVVVVRREGDGAVFEDRKSTRLNSSHVRISYAVFCLKKKKK